MNSTEFKNWELDAKRALAGKYSASDIEIIVSWFRSIKGQEERDLIGSEEVDAMLKFVCAGNKFDMYNSLMARLFIYAPFILEEHKKQGS